MCILAGCPPVFAGHLAYLLCLSCLTSVGLVLRVWMKERGAPSTACIGHESAANVCDALGGHQFV